MDVGSVVTATVGDEAVLSYAVPVTGKERIVLFGAPAACTLELYLEQGSGPTLDPVRLNKNWGGFPRSPSAPSLAVTPTR